jgi:SAM-dependent methyltransferase
MEDQSTLWNGPSGHAWVEAEAVLDRMLQPFEDVLVRAVAEASPGAVLDVGCGTGSTTLAVARIRGSCTGIDLSEPMLARARQRAEQGGLAARFICDDAESHAFEPRSFDFVMSRFGVMFFADPLRAFRNIRRAARAGCALRCVVWRGPEENPFMTTAERAAAPLLPNIPPRQPGGPGQFAFADASRVKGILTESGWSEIDIQPLDVACSLAEEDLRRYVTLLGPLARVLREVDDETRKRVVETVLAAFEPFVHGDEVRFDAACWIVSARAE